MEKQINPAVQIYLESASTGLWGMTLHTLLLEGRGHTLACLDKIAAGEAFVEVRVLFTQRGVAFVGEFCNHGERANLFEATLNSPSAPDAPPAAGALN